MKRASIKNEFKEEYFERIRKRAVHS